MLEVVAPEYVRQPILFTRDADGVVPARCFKSLNWVSFAPCIAWPTAKVGAVLDAQGAVLGYGALQLAPGGDERVDEICFAPSTIELRFF
jgi:hypothetical protein